MLQSTDPQHQQDAEGGRPASPADSICLETCFDERSNDLHDDCCVHECTSARTSASTGLEDFEFAHVL